MEVQKSKGSLSVTQAILGFLTIACGFASLEQPSFLVPAFLAGVVQAYCYLWFSRFSLQLNGSVLRYTTVLGGTREIHVEEIRRFELQIGEKVYRDKFRPPIRLEVEPYSWSGKKSFDINVKFFELDSMSKFVEEVNRFVAEVQEAPTPQVMGLRGRALGGER